MGIRDDIDLAGAAERADLDIGNQPPGIFDGECLRLVVCPGKQIRLVVILCLDAAAALPAGIHRVGRD